MLSITPHLVAAIFFAASSVAAPAERALSTENKIVAFVDWLFTDGQQLDAIPFSKLIEAVTGNIVHPVDHTDPQTADILQAISRAADAVVRELNRPNHSIHTVGRINEVSGHIEDFLREKLDALDGFSCDFPKTARGRIQRSGYPDLRLVDEASGRVFYIDPKLYADGSERSSFRTFYFEPKVETNKILDDASHLILGIAHGGRRSDGSWHFLRWKLVDLSTLTVRLKAEFQAGNRDLYREDAVVAEGEVAAPNR